MNGARGGTGLNRDVSGGRRPQVDSAVLLPPSRLPHRRYSFTDGRKYSRGGRRSESPILVSSEAASEAAEGAEVRKGRGRLVEWEEEQRRLGKNRGDSPQGRSSSCRREGEVADNSEDGDRRRVRPSSRGQGGGVEASSSLSFPIPSATLLVASRAGDDKPKPAISSCCRLPSSFLTSHSRLPYSFLKKLRET